MTVAPPSSVQQQVHASSSGRASNIGPVVRRSSLQEARPNNGSTRARRSSMSSKGKSSNKCSSVVVVLDKDVSNGMTTTAQTSAEGFLQSADKKRRYMRRGSKTSFMLRGANSFKVEMHPDWQVSLAASMTRGISATSASSTLDDGSLHSRQSTSSVVSPLIPSSSPPRDVPLSSHCGGEEDNSSVPFKESMAEEYLETSSPPRSTQRAAQLQMLRGANQNVSNGMSHPPLFHRAASEAGLLPDRRQSTVSLLSSALELSCIEDQNNTNSQL